MQPTMYGYMRVANDHATNDELLRIKHELTEYATREGFCLGEVFAEGTTCSESAFHTLLEALKRHRVRDVLVPSLWHFARLPGLQDAMRQHIEHETGARIWVMQGQYR